VKAGGGVGGGVVLEYYSHLGSTVLTLFDLGDSYSPRTATTSIGFTLYMTINFDRCGKILSDNKLGYHNLTINTHSFLTYGQVDLKNVNQK